MTRNRNEEVKRYDNRKRTLLESRSRGRSQEKRPRLAHLDQTRGLNDQSIGSVQKMEQPQLLNSSKDALRMLAISRGLDPNNQDVIKILEMTTQLEALQALTIKQRMEAQSLVIIGQAQDQLMQQRRESERQAQEQLMQQRRESERQEQLMQQRRESERQEQLMQQRRESERQEQLMQQRRESERQEQLMQQRRESERQEQLMKKRRESERQAQEELMQQRRESERHKASPHMFGQKGRWAEEESRKKRDEAEQKLKENISHKFQLLGELKGRMHQSEKSYRNSPKSVSTHTFGNEASIKPYRNAPPTIGLLGTGPLNVPSAPPAAAYPSQKDGKIKDSLFAFAGYQPGKDLSQDKGKHSSRSRSPREANKSRALRLNSSLERDGRSKNSFGRADRQSNDRHSSKQRSSSRQKSDNVHYGGRDNLDPSNNDTPLDFHKRSSFMSTEQAVKQDFDRTVQALREVKSTIPKREEKRTGAVEELYLPVQFGKNAVKKTPWEMEEEKRKALDRKRNYPDKGRDNNDRKLGNSKPGFRDTGYPRSNPSGEKRKDWSAGKGLLGSGPGDQSYDMNKSRGAPGNRFQGTAPETKGLLGSAPSEPPVRVPHGILKKNSVAGAVEKYDNVNREIPRNSKRNARANPGGTGMHRGRGNLRGGVGHTPFPTNNRGVNNPRVFNKEAKEEHEWGGTEHHDFVPPNSNRGNFKAGPPFRNPPKESYPGWKDLKSDYKPDYPTNDWNQEWSASGAEPSYYGAGQDPPDTYSQEQFYPPEEPYVEEFGGPIEEHHAPEYPEIPVDTRAPLPLDNAEHYGEIGESAWQGTYDHHPVGPLPVHEESAGPAEAPLEYEGYGYSGESTEYPTEPVYYEGQEEYYDDNQFKGKEYAPAFRGHPTRGRIGLNRGRTRPFRGRGESIRGHNSYRGRVAQGPAVPEQQYDENVDMDWSSYPSDPAPNFGGEESTGRWGFPAGRGRGRGAFNTGSLLPTPHERENSYVDNTKQQTQGWGGGQRSQFPPPYTNRGRGNTYF
ncbi:capping protein-inhibiting regulator of actin dynamics-like [Physella acuta]|uniref:capping protein-inhibiting regulator of actin dynamics-like n=1 Tax=Physella acuta TaxID=109671 RepID=UPI0027DBF4D4|nr:capping protein-inhibiting regulator of actin dynamics-like [Physella acuta]